MRAGPGSGSRALRLVALHLVGLAGPVAAGHHDDAVVPAVGPCARRGAQRALDDVQRPGGRAVGPDCQRRACRSRAPVLALTAVAPTGPTAIGQAAVEQAAAELAAVVLAAGGWMLARQWALTRLAGDDWAAAAARSQAGSARPGALQPALLGRRRQRSRCLPSQRPARRTRRQGRLPARVRRWLRPPRAQPPRAQPCGYSRLRQCRHRWRHRCRVARGSVGRRGSAIGRRQTLAVTNIWSFSASGAIRHQVRGSDR